jgi:patatin-related protein
MPIDEQELRFAVVMNGGVSLAVWMGGVTRELDRARRRDGAYGQLAALTRTVPRVDVIAGSSAGGINGAILSVAIARGADVSVIRDLWLDDGSINDLLRDPLRKDAPSLFLGDERLLDRVGYALRTVAGSGTTGPVQPLHLTITGTTLQGEVKAYADHFGAVIPDVDHRARFVFRRGRVGRVPEGSLEELQWPDEFADDVALAQVALAARSSASFPVAFEPSFCPADEAGPAPGMDPAHPNMAGPANFSRSRWVIDGGVLVNTPFRPALDAVATLPADAEVRRVLAYVVPNPVAAEAEADDRANMPAAMTVATDAGSRLPRVQSIGRELEEIAANNKAVRRRRRARACTLEDLTGDTLENAAETLLQSYRCVRREAAVADIIDLVLAGRRDRDYAAWKAEAAKTGTDHRREPWRRAPRIEEVEALRSALSRSDMPWLPPDVPWREMRLDPWRWGLAPVEHAGNLLLDLLRTALAVDVTGPRRDGVVRLRGELHDRLMELRRATAMIETFWKGQANLLDDPGATGEAMRQWPSLMSGVPPIAFGMAGVVDALWERFGSESGDDAPVLRSRLEPLVAQTRDGRVETIVRRLLALDVVLRSSGAEISGLEQDIELVLMSAEAANAFDARSEPREKLAGLQVHHFGSFYKRSWRANDWMWGRLDGADRIVRTMLDPRRIRLRLDAGTSVADVFAELRAIAVPETGSALDADAVKWLAEQWDLRADDTRAELEQLPAEPLATGLPLAHEAIRRRVQLEVLVEEVAVVRDAARADLEAKTARDVTGARWQASVPAGTLSGGAARAAFATCKIGTETLGNEVGSDHFTSVATRTLGVTGSVAARVPLPKVVRPAQNTVRGVLLSLHLLGRGVVTGSRTASFLVALVLALGGALVALSLLGVDVPGALVLLGVTLLVAGVLLGLIRRMPFRVLFVLLAYAATVAAYYALQQWDDQPDWIDPVATTFAIVLLAVTATALGYGGRRAPVAALALLTLILLGIAAAALWLPDDEAAGETAGPATTGVEPLAPQDIEAINTSIEELRKGQDRDDRALGALLTAVAAGSPIAMQALTTWLQSAQGLTQQAAQAVLGALAKGGITATLKGSISPSATFTTSFAPTLQVESPQLSLGGLHVGARGVPSQVRLGDFNFALTAGGSPLVRDFEGLLGSQTFVFGSAALTPSGKYLLRRIRERLRRDPDAISHIDIRGYADYVDTRAENRRLARRRAERVKAFLLRGSGLSPDVVDVTAYGEDRALASTRGDRLRAYDRRVDVVVIGERGG